MVSWKKWMVDPHHCTKSIFNTSVTVGQHLLLMAGQIRNVNIQRRLKARKRFLKFGLPGSGLALVQIPFTSWNHHSWFSVKHIFLRQLLVNMNLCFVQCPVWLNTGRQHIQRGDHIGAAHTYVQHQVSGESWCSKERGWNFPASLWTGLRIKIGRQTKALFLYGLTLPMQSVLYVSLVAVAA